MIKNLFIIVSFLVSTSAIAEQTVIETFNSGSSIAQACDSAKYECDIRVYSHSYRCKKNGRQPSLVASCDTEYGITPTEYTCTAVAVVDCK